MGSLCSRPVDLAEVGLVASSYNGGLAGSDSAAAPDSVPESQRRYVPPAGVVERCRSLSERSPDRKGTRASVHCSVRDSDMEEARREWQPHGLDRGMGLDEIGVWGNRRHSASGGMGLKSFPSTGEFVIRVQASAILPPGVKGAPLRLIMGQTLNGSTQRVEPVGSAYLDNSPDEPRVLEFRGRIENYPLTRGRMIRGNQQPDSRVITPQVLYDDGTLNDGNRNLTMPRIVINWMEFEAPVRPVRP